MQITSAGKVRLGITFLLCAGLITYFLRGNSSVNDDYAAAIMGFFLLVVFFWYLYSLRLPVISFALEGIVIAITLIAFPILGGLIVLALPFVVLTTVWCVLELIRLSAKSPSQGVSRPVIVVFFLFLFAGITLILYLGKMGGLLINEGLSPAG